MGKALMQESIKGTISSNVIWKEYRRQQQWIIKPKGLLIYNPKTIICEAQAKKSWICFEGILEREYHGEKQNGCSSEKERKVNALALRADEGRDNLR